MLGHRYCMEARHDVKKNEKAIVRVMCDWKVRDRKATQEQMDMLGLKETVRWVGKSK